MLLFKSRKRKPSVYPATFVRAGSGLNQAGKIFPQNTPRMERQRLIKNIAVNAQFLNGTSGWYSSSSNFVVEAGRGKVIPVSQWQGIAQLKNTAIGHKYYVKADIEGGTDIRFGFPGAQTDIIGTSPLQTVAGVYTATLTQHNIGTTEGKAAAPWVAHYMDNLVIVDLTEVHCNGVTGTGLEPSLAECNLIYANAKGGPLIQPANPVWVEENTINLLPRNRALTLDIAEFYVQNGPTVSVDTSTPNPVSASSLKIVTPGIISSEGISALSTSISVSQTYTTSVWLKGSGTVVVELYERNSGGSAVGSSSSSAISLTNIWTRYDVTRSFGPLGVYAMPKVVTLNTNVATIYCAGFQLEQKPYATTFTVGERSAEEYSLPVQLSPVQGCIRLWCYFNNASRRLGAAGFRIFGVERSIGGTGLGIIHQSDGANWYVSSKNDAGVESPWTTIADTYTSNGWHLIVMKWSTSEIKVLVDGVVRATIASPPLPSSFKSVIGLGGFNTTLPTYVLGGMIDEVHVSNDYPTDAQLLTEYLTYPAVPYANTVSLVRPRFKVLKQDLI